MEPSFHSHPDLRPSHHHHQHHHHHYQHHHHQHRRGQRRPRCRLSVSRYSNDDCSNDNDDGRDDHAITRTRLLKLRNGPLLCLYSYFLSLICYSSEYLYRFFALLYIRIGSTYAIISTTPNRFYHTSLFLFFVCSLFYFFIFFVRQPCPVLLFFFIYLFFCHLFLITFFSVPKP